MSQYERILPPGVVETEIGLNDVRSGYEHTFTLHYIIRDDIEVPITKQTFAFG